jgi:hypothetical protein
VWNETWLMMPSRRSNAPGWEGGSEEGRCDTTDGSLTDVLVPGYQDVDAATEDFNGLMQIDEVGRADR